MNQIKLLIQLTRLNKPIGFMLLFWPCSWGLTLAYDFKEEKITYFYYLILFFIGSVLMRSAGCIINDIADRKFDKKVSRTKNRPIANGSVSVLKSFFYGAILCMVALGVLLQFNNLTILLGLLSMPLAFTYPFMKRITYWPQLFLGITFNYGLLLGWTAIYNHINIIPVIFYLGAVFWTLGYDTIYGFQDIKDDEIIGLKSTSIKFKKNPLIFLTICYILFLSNLLITGILKELGTIFYIMFVVVGLQLLYFQLKKLDINNSLSCLKIFNSNNYVGLSVTLSLILGKI